MDLVKAQARVALEEHFTFVDGEVVGREDPGAEGVEAGVVQHDQRVPGQAGRCPVVSTLSLTLHSPTS